MVGKKTQIGKIAQVISREVKFLPPLVVRIEKFTRVLAIIVVVLTFLFALIAIAKGYPIQEIFFLSVALAVSAIPEGLPIAITVALSIAARKMAKRRVIVRKLSAVEALGSCTTIASDKTGTLTFNRQTIKKIQLPCGATYEVEGDGYIGVGVVKDANTKEVVDIKAFMADGLRWLIYAGCVANEAELYFLGGDWCFNGDEVDIAFLALGYKVELMPSIKEEIKSLAIEPYSSENKYSAASCTFGAAKYYFIKGALEVILPLCGTQINADGATTALNAECVLNQAYKLTSSGYRVMAVAGCHCITNTSQKSLVFYGLVGMQDPIRVESKAAINKCHIAGIIVNMVTGDHPKTAFAIAKELNIAKDISEVITGEELEDYKKVAPENLYANIKFKRVFARVSPLQKMEIVKILHEHGNFVAVTGDGVNDVPALKKANIGVAMGSGTDLTKDISDMIVINDDFSSIVAGIEEGRFAYSNIRKVTYLLVSCGFAEILLLLLALITSLPLPLTAIQLLWLNLVTNGVQDKALAFERGEPYVMSEMPRPPHESLFNRLMIEEVLISGLSIGLIAYTAWFYMLKIGVSELHARSLLFMLMVFLENVHVFNCRSEKISVFKTPISSNYFVIIAVVTAQFFQLVVAHIPVMHTVLQTDFISFYEWLHLFLLALALLLIMELYKFFRFKINLSCALQKA